MIVGWRNPISGRTHELDDFEGMSPAIPEAVLRAMSRKIKLDTRHSGPNITITSGLGCPRKLLTTRMLPTTPDPCKMWAMQRGTWLHECVGLSLSENSQWITEERNPDACTFAGTLWDIPISCRVDAYRKDHTELIDWKFRKDGAERWIDPAGAAKIEDASQLNMMRLLMEQNWKEDLSDMDMAVWVMAGQTIRTHVPYMTLDQIGAVRPGGAAYSVREIFSYIHEAMELWKDAGVEEATTEKRQEIIGAMPMVGADMYKSPRYPQNNMCTKYCEVNDACYACNDTSL